MKLVFDLGIIDSNKYGMQYATLQLMQALKNYGLTVENFVSGWQGILEHCQLMQQEKIASRFLPLPKKVHNFLINHGLDLEKIFFPKFDYYLQVGLHAQRNIPKEKFLLSIHDIVSLRYPEGEMPFPPYAQDLMNSAKQIITVSEFSKKEIALEFKINPSKIKVIYNGIDLQRFNNKNNLGQFKKIQKKYNLPNRYLLTFGGNTKRKNIDRLCQAVNGLKYPLVVFGGYQPEKNYSNTIILNYLPEKEVELILKNAFVFVFPSYYEGFGLPILEAMACGVPVACARAASLPEIAGDAALLFDPFEETDIKAKINRLIEDSTLRKNNIKNGLQWGRKFSWEAAAKSFLAILNK